MLIHGIYHFGKERVDSRTEVCNCCEELRVIEQWRSFDVLHFFFIPLLPLGSHARWKCTSCQQDPHARYKTSKAIKVLGLIAMGIFLVGLFSFEPPAEDVPFMWGARIVLGLAFLGFLYAVVKKAPATAPPMLTGYKGILAQLQEQLGDVFRAASSSDLDKLRKLRLPEGTIEFYRAFEPVQMLENEQGVRLHTIAELVEQNADFVPGCYIAPQGYVVFATNFSGDAYAFDVNQLDASGAPRVVLFSHEMINEQCTRAEMGKLAKPVAAHLSEFLGQFMRNEVDEECREFDYIK